MEAAALVGKIAFSAVLSSVLITSCSASDSPSEPASLSEISGANTTAQTFNGKKKYSGILLSDVDFNIAKIKVTEAPDSGSPLKEGDVCLFEYARLDNDDRLSLYSLDVLFREGRSVEFSFFPDEAQIEQNDSGEYVITAKSGADGWTMTDGGTPAPEDTDITEYTVDGTYNGSMILVTKEEYEQWKQQRSSEK